MNKLEFSLIIDNSLYAVSKRYGVSVSEIKRLNGLSSNVISIGQRLRIR